MLAFIDEAADDIGLSVNWEFAAATGNRVYVRGPVLVVPLKMIDLGSFPNQTSGFTVKAAVLGEDDISTQEPEQQPDRTLEYFLAATDDMADSLPAFSLDSATGGFACGAAAAAAAEQDQPSLAW